VSGNKCKANQNRRKCGCTPHRDLREVVEHLCVDARDVRRASAAMDVDRNAFSPYSQIGLYETA